MRILLTSDIHICHEKHLELLTEIVKIANNDNCDYLLIAGDLFNSNEDALTYSQPVKQVLSSFSGKVYCIPGNHDTDLAKIINLGNGTCFNAIQQVTLNDGYSLIPIPYQKNESFGAVIKKADFPALTSKSIVLAHGTLYDSPFFLKSEDRSYFPISIKEVEKTGIGYLCLGHYHTVIREKIGETICLNAGAPRATRKSDLGKRSCFSIDTSANEITTRFLKTEYNILLNVHINLINESKGFNELISEAIRSLQIPAEDYSLINLNINLIGISTKIFNESDDALKTLGLNSYKYNYLELRTMSPEAMRHPVVDAVKNKILNSGDENKEKLVLSILSDALMKVL